MMQNIFSVFLVRTLGISQFLIQGVNIRREGTQTVIRCGNRRVGKSELPSRNAVYQCWLILCELMGAGDFKRDIPVIESVVVIGVCQLILRIDKDLSFIHFPVSRIVVFHLKQIIF